MRIAFYAPLKPPDHPVPSGDRTMARALVRALRFAGHEVVQPSGLRSFVPAPDATRFAEIAALAEAETDRIARSWADGPPDFWFTYHNYYKAPDLLGPVLARRLDIPYGLAEASHAPRRAALWGPWHEAATRATHAARLHLASRSAIAPA